MALLAGLFAGCERPPAADQTRLCRSAAAGLAAISDARRLESQRALASGTGVQLVYAPPGRPREWLECRFRSGAPASPDALLGLRTAQGDLGAVRLHLMRRYWLSAAAGLAVDLSPVVGVEAAPIVGTSSAQVLQALLHALPSLATYGLLASAYSLVFGLVGRINLAFGEIALVGGIGAFLGLALAPQASPLWLALAAALAGAAAAALAFGRLTSWALAGPFTHGSGQAAMVASIGLALVLAETIRLLQGPRTLWLPPILHGSFALARAGDYVVVATPVMALVTLVALSAGLILLVIMRRARFGRAWRAAADDPVAAALMGLDTRRLLGITFAIAAGLAGLAGALAALQFGAASTSGGIAIALKALVAAVVGGIGSVTGAFLGAATIALAEAAWATLLPIEHRDIFILLVLAAFLALRPEGLLGTDHRGPPRR